MPLISAYLTPHGMQIIPGLEETYDENFRPLHEAMLKLQEEIQKDDPELIVLLTPHGLAMDEAFGVYQSEHLRGDLPHLSSSNVDGKIKERLQFPSDPAISSELISFLKEKKVNITSITLGSTSFPAPLAWGEIVPLYYLDSGEKKTKVIIISIPKKRFNLDSFKNELMQLGHNLESFFQKKELRTALIISADLAHTHLEKGPYGYHPSADKLDHLVNQWITVLEKEFLIDQIYPLAETGLACGLAPITVFQGVIQATRESSWNGTLVSYAKPTYFGMSAAFFKKKY
jgi:aromatic ring-opening dioxygenase LigB subunit